MKLYNSLTRQIEEITPINPPKVGMYTCGPTVYSYPTIGNWRTYTTGDILLRALRYEGYKVRYVMNLTDVGHLTGDNEGDADTGEDRLEKAARREGKNAWDIAEFYSEDFLAGLDKLNMITPDNVCRATEHIKEQIEMVQKIEKHGFTYKIQDGIYFDVANYEKSGHKYGELSTLDQIKAGARVEPNPDKHDPRDFALWKFSPSGVKRDMEWESPWGVGFPGWHIECSAMSTKYLGDQFDVHVGGEDLRSTHHPNEIAQSEAATGKSPFVKYWIHGAFLTVDGGRMGKSLGNAYLLQDIEKRGIDILALRYFYLSGHYRKQLNFTWEALDSAAVALSKLQKHIREYKSHTANERTKLSEEKLGKINSLQKEFQSAIGEDLNMPQALAIVWETIKSNIPSPDKLDLLYSFDEVLGFGLKDTKSEAIPENILNLARERDTLREEKKYTDADTVRAELEGLGYTVTDTSAGTVVSKQ